MAGAESGSAAGRDAAGEAHRRVLRQSALEANGDSRRACPGRDARRSSIARSRRGTPRIRRTPVQPALHLIAVVASDDAGHVGKVSNAHGQRDDRAGLRLGAAAGTRCCFSTSRSGRERCRRSSRDSPVLQSGPTSTSAIDPEFSMKHGENTGNEDRNVRRRGRQLRVSLSAASS